MKKFYYENAKFSDLTTIRVGGYIERFFQPASKESFINLLSEEKGTLFVLGAGSNTLASDETFAQTVVRTRFGKIEVVKKQNEKALIRSDTGIIWDDFVSSCAQMGLQGVESLSGIPGTVGAAVVQNIGAYGSEVSETVAEVEVWDRKLGRVEVLDRSSMEFGYRTSLIKKDIQSQSPFAPNPRFVVLSALFSLSCDSFAPIKYGSVAEQLKKPMGSAESVRNIRKAVLAVRGAKNMLEDPARYQSGIMKDMTPERLEGLPLPAAPNFDRCSCGSFFTNPVVSLQAASLLPPSAPKYPASKGVKLSAAWLIEHAGFEKGYPLKENPRAKAALSTSHALAITNRGSAGASDVMSLANEVRRGVKEKFGIDLALEPVLVGLEEK